MRNIRNYPREYWNSDKFVPRPCEYSDTVPIEAPALYWHIVSDGVLVNFRRNHSSALRFIVYARDNTSRFNPPVPAHMVVEPSIRGDGYTDYILYRGNDYLDALRVYCDAANYVFLCGVAKACHMPVQSVYKSYTEVSDGLLKNASCN